MVGISTTSAPSSSNCRESWLACSRVRVTTIRRPNNLRFSNQLSFDRNFTTSPITVTVGADSFARAAASAMVARVPSTERCRPVVPQCTIATGVSAGRPYLTSSSAIRPIRSVAIMTTLVPGVRATCAQSTPLKSLAGSSCPVMTIKLELCSR